MSIAQTTIDTTVAAVEVTADTAIAVTETVAEGVAEVAKQSTTVLQAITSKLANTNLATAGKYTLGVAVIGAGAYGAYRGFKFVRAKLSNKAA